MPNAAQVRLIEVLCEAVSWGHDTFPQETVQSLANHIAKEAKELQAAPTDPDEIADVLMLLAGLIDKAGVDVAEACRRKLAENRTRAWGEPGPDGVTHHIQR